MSNEAMKPEPASNEQDAFEQKFPMPRYCSRFTGGYAATDHNAWDAHSHCLRWEGWKARANTTPPQQEPVAWEISGKLTALREVQAFVDKHVREVEDSLRQLSNTTPPPRESVGLTEEEIWPWFQENTALTNESAMRIVRAIEAAHGIKENT